MGALKRYGHWIPRLVLIAIFLMMAVPKLTDAQASRTLFGEIDVWLGVAALFEPYLRYLIGVAEAVAAVLLLLSSFRVYGALIGFVIIIGALFFHLVGPLYPAGDVGDPSIFYMAIVVLIASVAILIIDGDRLPFIGKGAGGGSENGGTV